MTLDLPGSSGSCGSSAAPTTSVRLSPHSSATRQLLRSQVPLNTKRATNTSLRVFARHVISCLTSAESDARDASPVLNTASPSLEAPAKEAAMQKGDDEEERNQKQLLRAREIVFSDGNDGYLPPGHSDWTEAQLKQVRHHLIQFVLNYKSPKLECAVKPRTMMSYLRGLERGFWMEWDYKIKILEGPVFNCPKEGLVVAVNTRFSEQEAEQHVPKSENSLSEADLVKLFGSPSLSRDRARSFQARLVMEMMLLTALSPCALVQLRTSHFEKVKSAGVEAWRFRGPVGHRTDTVRPNAENFGQKTMEIIIPNKPSLNDELNVYQDIDDYMKIRSSLDVGTDRFFLAINMRGNRFEEFFKRQHLGRNSFTRIVADVCKAEGVLDVKAKNLLASQDLLGTQVMQHQPMQTQRSNINIPIQVDDSSSEESQDLPDLDDRRQQNDIVSDVANFLKRCSEALGRSGDSTAGRKRRLDIQRKLDIMDPPKTISLEQLGEGTTAGGDEENAETQLLSVSRLNTTPGCSVTINLNIHCHRK